MAKLSFWRIISVTMVLVLMATTGAAIAPAGPVHAFTTTPMVAVGYDHAAGLNSDGTVVAAPSYRGECQVGSWTDIIQVAAGGDYTLGLKSDHTVVCATEAHDWWYIAENISKWTDIIQVSAGNVHALGLKSDGTVVALGYNLGGRCNVSSWTDIIQVSAGMDHSVGLKSDGTVVAVGDDSYGQGEVSTWTDIIQIAASPSARHTVGLKSDGTVVAVGLNNSGQCNVSSWTGIQKLSAGLNRTAGLKADGTVITTLGSPDWTGVYQVAVGPSNIVYLMSDGYVESGGSYPSWNLGVPPAAAPTVTSVNPNSGNAGQSPSNVVITGTSFTGATPVSFGADITVNSFNVDSATQITASITIAAGAEPGLRDVSVTTAAGTGTLTNGFTILPAAPTGKIAFASARDGNWDIYIMNADGSGQTRLTTNTAIDDYPALSPDGTRIAFNSNRDGYTEIYFMNANGSGQTRLTNDSAFDAFPAWSPDGTKIAFQRQLGSTGQIYVMNAADGSGQTRLTNNSAYDWYPEWSPDGTKIAFNSNRLGADQIYIMSANGSGQTNISNNSANDRYPAWSPDGTKIAFDSNRNGPYEIYVMNASDGSNQTRLTNNSWGDYYPAWSPDGTKIAFLSERDGGNREIYVMNADGTGQVNISNNAADDRYPAWSAGPPPVVPPTVTTNNASNVQDTSATLNGTLTNNGGDACEYQIQYDTDQGEPYAHATGWTGSKNTGQTFLQEVTGLSAGSKYYFRAQSRNSAGTSSGTEMNFTTTPSVSKLIGASDVAPSSNLAAGYLTLTQWNAIASGNLNQIRVKCGAPGNVKVALYADASGAPGALLAANNTGQAVVSGWNTINLPASAAIISGPPYWLALNSDAACTNLVAGAGTGVYKALTYSSSFPNPAGTGFTSGAFFSISQGWGTPPVLTITTTSLPTGTQGTAYSQTLLAIGGTTPYTWTVSAGSLPAGLALNSSTGVISGTPTATGTANFTAQVADGAAATDTQELSITVNSPPPLNITSTSLPEASVGTAYSQTLQATGGIPPYTWTVSAGSLPTGLALNASTGLISGPPSSAGTSNFTIQIADSAPTPTTDTQALSIIVSLPLSKLIGASDVAPSSNLAAGYLTLTQWNSIASGNLNQIRVKCGAPGNVKVALYADASGAPGALLAANNTGQAVVSGWNTINLPASAAIISGPPYWLALNSDAACTNLVAGAGTGVYKALTYSSSFPNPAGTGFTSGAFFSISQGWGTPPVLTITTTSLPTGTQGTAYSQTLLAIGGTTPYTWTVSAGSLPAGLALNSSTGVISGTPTATGTANFTAQVADGAAATDTQELSITVNSPPPLNITSTSLPEASVGTAYSQTLQATGGIPPYTWTVSAGSLPTGLALNASTGLISGPPSSAGTSNFTIQIADSAPTPTTDTQALSIIVSLPLSKLIGASDVAPSSNLAAGYLTLTQWNSIASGNLNQIRVKCGAPGNVKVALYADASGAPGALLAANNTGQAVVSGWNTINLPASAAIISGPPYWLALNSDAACTNLVAGAGTGVYKALTYSSSFPNPAGTGFTSGAFFSISQGWGTPPVLTITTTSLPTGTQGTAYSQTLLAIGGTTPYTWTVSAGSLPAGLALNSSTGVISGTPTATGTANFTAQVADGAAATDTQELSITVNSPPPLNITSTSLPEASVGTAYSQTLQATGGIPPYTWTVSAGSLPTGLALNASTGLISGPPSSAGTSNFTIQIADSAPTPTTDTQALSIIVSLPLSKLIGASDVAPSSNLAAGYLTLTQWNSIASGNLNQIRVKCGAPGNVKVALYADASGAPGALLAANNTGQAVVSGWNTINLPASAAIISGPPYWLALNSDAACTNLVAGAGTGVYKALTYSSSFPNPAGTGFTSGAFFSISQGWGTPPVLTITTTSLPTGTQGTAYSQTLLAIGGTTPYTWTVSAGSLPAGLALNSSTGVISGTPTATGTANFTAQVADGAAATDTQELSITVNSPPPLNITSTSLPEASVGTAYSQTLQATGGIPPYTWTVSAGSLPTGLALNASTGLISGPPSSAGTSNFTIQIADSAPTPTTDTQALSIIVSLPLSKLIGASDVAPSSNLAAGYLTLTQWNSIASGNLNQIRVKCGAPGNVKVALYADASGAPGALLAANNTGQAVVSGWNTINLPASAAIISGPPYWLALNSDAACTNLVAGAGTGVYKALTYSSSFPNPAGTGFTSGAFFSISQGWGTPPSAPGTAPSLLSPGTAITFTWGAVAGASRYHLQVNTSSEFSGTDLFNSEVGNVTLREVTGLSLGTTYYWRVKAGNDAGWGPWSAARNTITNTVP